MTRNEDQVGFDFVEALVNFYQLDAFKGLAKTPLYIFGESYAGHFIPSVSNAILEFNNNTQHGFTIPLKGRALI